MTTLTVFIVSGGLGISGDQLVRTALAQFLTNNITVTVIPHVRSLEEVSQVIAQAFDCGGIIVHTLVDPVLRNKLMALANTNQVIQFDLMGPLLDQLAHRLKQNPLGKPGLYRKMREGDLRRIEAIEFAVDHDDGKRAHELHQAEIVLTGVSRVGKTPLSMYLSTMGWKVGNVPLINGLEPPPILFEVDPSRVVGLMIEPGQLIAYRRRRGQHVGLLPGAAYTTPEDLINELAFAQDIFRGGQFSTVDVTDKPIEESAEEIIAKVKRR